MILINLHHPSNELTVSRPRLLAFAAVVLLAILRGPADIAVLVRRCHLASPRLSRGWADGLIRFCRFLSTRGRYLCNRPIGTKGNVKLGAKFSVWSTLPILTCPGAGACAVFCYSFTGWRNPGAYFRQLQNTALAVTPWGRKIIRREFLNLRRGSDFRLFVDGDFHNLGALKFWQNLLSERPDVRAYGYSKSLHLFRAYHDAGERFAPNYVLNLSSGGVHPFSMAAGLPIVRGSFNALSIPREASRAGYRTRPYVKAVQAAARDAGIGRTFVCPGTCEACTPRGHACGRVDFSVPVSIGIH